MKNGFRKAMAIGTILVAGLGAAGNAYAEQPKSPKASYGLSAISIPGTDYKAQDRLALAALYADEGVIEKTEKIQVTSKTDGLRTSKMERIVPVENPAVNKMSPLERYEFRSRVLEGICKKISPGDNTITYEEASGLFNRLTQIPAYQYSGNQ